MPGRDIARAHSHTPHSHTPHATRYTCALLLPLLLLLQIGTMRLQSEAGKAGAARK